VDIALFGIDMLFRLFVRALHWVMRMSIEFISRNILPFGCISK